jgi:von Willebrand factor type A domain
MLTKTIRTTWCLNVAIAVLAGGCGDAGGEATGGGSRFETPEVDGSGRDPNGPPLEGEGGVVSPDASTPADAAPPTCAATVAEVGKPKVDIVFVIDNSGSMDAEMTQVKANVNTFARTIGQSGVDYRVIMMVAKAATPAQTGLVLCVPAPLGGPNCSDNLPIFRHVNQSVGSTNALSLVLSTYDSANPALAWRSALRPEALKAFVVVTDDQSAITSQAFDAQLLAKQPAGMFGTTSNRRYVFHTIAGWQEGTPVLSATKCASAVNTGSRYQELSRLTGGIVDSVCKADYSGVLANIARNTAQRLACELGLPSQANADPHKVAVQVTPVGGVPVGLTRVVDASRCAANPNSWYYDDNAHPTRVMLCADTCASINAQQGAKIEALVGCVTEIPR